MKTPVKSFLALCSLLRFRLVRSMGRPMRWLGTPLGRLWDGFGTPNGTVKIVNVSRPWDGGTPDLPPSQEKRTSAPRVPSLPLFGCLVVTRKHRNNPSTEFSRSTWREPRILREIRSYAQLFSSNRSLLSFLRFSTAVPWSRIPVGLVVLVERSNSVTPGI